MNELERYLFDLQGFLVVEDAVGPEQIAAINQLLDKQIAHVDEPGKPCFRKQPHWPLQRRLAWQAMLVI